MVELARRAVGERAGDRVARSVAEVAVALEDLRSRGGPEAREHPSSADGARDLVVARDRRRDAARPARSWERSEERLNRDVAAVLESARGAADVGPAPEVRHERWNRAHRAEPDGGGRCVPEHRRRARPESEEDVGLRTSIAELADRRERGGAAGAVVPSRGLPERLERWVRRAPVPTRERLRPELRERVGERVCVRPCERAIEPLGRRLDACAPRRREHGPLELGVVVGGREVEQRGRVGGRYASRRDRDRGAAHLDVRRPQRGREIGETEEPIAHQRERARRARHVPPQHGVREEAHDLRAEDVNRRRRDVEREGGVPERRGERRRIRAPHVAEEPEAGGAEPDEEDREHP